MRITMRKMIAIFRTSKLTNPPMNAFKTVNKTKRKTQTT
jgi:hypothetical protein